MKHDEYAVPPGCKVAILEHPSGADESVEVALFHDHRYAFFFWSIWTNQLNLGDSPPALISLDWHEDLLLPTSGEQVELAELNQSDRRELALFCWENLSVLNDSHILAAAYLNLIGDVYVVRKQVNTEDGSSFDFRDLKNQSHTVQCFDTVEQLMKELKKKNPKNVFFDIDLDYFTESDESSGGGEDVELVSDAIVRATLNPDSELLQWIFERFAGMTVATEPEFCGGLVNSNHLLSLMSESLFQPQLLADDASWRHLRKDEQ